MKLAPPFLHSLLDSRHYQRERQCVKRCNERLGILHTIHERTHSHGHGLKIAQTPRLLSIGSFYGLEGYSGYACPFRSKFEGKQRADERTRTADLLQLRVCGQWLPRVAHSA